VGGGVYGVSDSGDDDHGAVAFAPEEGDWGADGGGAPVSEVQSFGLRLNCFSAPKERAR
jgi:hypothetical protein